MSKFEIIKFVVEIFVLLLILREIFELKKHRITLEHHSEELEKVRPLFTTLYTNGDDILQLGIKVLEVIYHIILVEKSIIEIKRKQSHCHLKTFFKDMLII